MISSAHVRASFEEAAQTLAAFLADPQNLDAVSRFAAAAHATLARGGLLMSCGNGGSMCDAMHFAEEWTGRFRKDRAALPAIAFSDPSQLTCIANDFGYDEVFARSVDAYGKSGDLLVAISTSGNSPSVLAAVEVARRRGMVVIGMTGAKGRRLAAASHVALVTPSEATPRIQEGHIAMGHALCELVERALFPPASAAGRGAGAGRAARAPRRTGRRSPRP
jgi:D-sedoheptulose 7-phosphate isomerase